MSALIDRVARAATDEIYGTIEYGGTGLYWMDDQWNISCDLMNGIENDPTAGRYYRLYLNLQKPNNTEPVIIDHAVTVTDSEPELYEAIKRLVTSNRDLIDQINMRSGLHALNSRLTIAIEELKRKNAELCISCGEIIPEGRMMCPNCERRYDT